MANTDGSNMKRNCWVSGLHKIFASAEDLTTCTVVNAYKDQVNEYTVIYVVCDSQDEAIFGEEYKTGTKWIIANKTVFGGNAGSGGGETYFSGENIFIDASNEINALGYKYDSSLESFAEGIGTETTNEGEHAEGIYNKSNQIDGRIPKGFVDFGLPSGALWAKNNLDATCGSSVESWRGGYYAYGETITKNDYSQETYDVSLYEKYSLEEGGFTELQPEDDAATVKLGTRYKIPNREEFMELLDHTLSKSVYNYKGILGLNGRLIYKADVTPSFKHDPLYIDGVVFGEDSSIVQFDDDMFDEFKYHGTLNKINLLLKIKTGLDNFTDYVFKDPNGEQKAVYGVDYSFKEYDEDPFYCTDSSLYTDVTGKVEVLQQSEFFILLLLMFEASEDDINFMFGGGDQTYNIRNHIFKNQECTQLAEYGVDYRFGNIDRAIDESTYIFVPVTGIINGTSLIDGEYESPLLTSTIDDDIEDSEYGREFYSVTSQVYSILILPESHYREYGYTIRPITYKVEEQPLETVDLGLPTGLQWAKMNVGAQSETDYGNYYAWGETETKSVYDSSTYDVSLYEKYNNDGGLSVLAAEDDVATVEYGNNYRMPTKSDVEELFAYTNHVWVDDFEGSGINGVKFINKTDNSKYIFLPAGSYYDEDGIASEGIDIASISHTSTIYEESENENYAFGYVNLNNMGVLCLPFARVYGVPVRPVYYDESVRKTYHTQHSIGIGSSDDNRKNAVEIMNDGKVYVHGIGNYDGTNPDDASTLQQIIGQGGGCPTYEEGTGIDIEGDVINANSNAVLDASITLSSGAPIDARSIWTGGVIPAGESIQSILTKLLCRELYPAAATLPDISVGNDSKGAREIGSTITLSAPTATNVAGHFNSSDSTWAQPYAVYGSDSIIVSGPTINNGFTGEGSTKTVVLGSNTATYSYSMNYYAPTNKPVTNIGNETTVTADGTSATWGDDSVSKTATVTATGCYPCYTNIKKVSDVSTLVNDVSTKCTIGVYQNTSPLVIDVPSESVYQQHFKFMYEWHDDDPEGVTNPRRELTVEAYNDQQRKWEMYNRTPNYTTVVNYGGSGKTYRIWETSGSFVGEYRYRMYFSPGLSANPS